jgi:hypothetical protein
LLGAGSPKLVVLITVLCSLLDPVAGSFVSPGLGIFRATGPAAALSDLCLALRLPLGQQFPVLVLV